MTRAAQIVWWIEQVEAARVRVGEGRDRRRRLVPPSPTDDEIFCSRRAALPDVAPPRVIRGRTITGAFDEERSRVLPVSPGGGGTAPARSSGRGASGSGASGGGAGSRMDLSGGGALDRARKLAAGYQPAVVKVVSYARGVARATATGQYVQREDVPLETQDGRMLIDREAVAEEIKVWSTNFSKRAESQDVGDFRLTLQDVRDSEEGRAAYAKAIAAAFDGHRHAWRLAATPEGTLEARIVLAMAGGPKERFRVREERVRKGDAEFVRKRLDFKSETLIKDRIAATGMSPERISIRPGGTSHGRDGVAFRLDRLVERGPTVDDRGKTIANVADARIAAREWNRSLRSQSSRDTMHLIMSAKAGTDADALTRAARAFLHDRFADHRFMFGVHRDKEAAGHIHAHAVIAVKSESGQKIHPGPDTFDEWRRVYAEHAQAEGLKIVATSARERASSQSYGPRDKAIVDAADRPRPHRQSRDRAYAADPTNRVMIEKARQRIAAARTNPIRLPVAASDRKAVNESVLVWKAVAAERPNNLVAHNMVERLTMAQTIGGILHTIGRRVAYLNKENPNMAITSEKMARDLRLMNEAVSRTSDLLDGQTKQQFREASSRYLETLANRVDLQRAAERGVTQMTRAEVEAIAGVNADKLIARANAVQADEQREAADAARLADRAIEVERKQEAATKLDPTSQRELRAERATVVNAQTSAAREAREAAAANEAARAIALHPGEPMSPTNVQTDALARLRVEQEKVIQEIEAAEKTDAQSQRGQRMKP